MKQVLISWYEENSKKAVENRARRVLSKTNIHIGHFIYNKNFLIYFEGKKGRILMREGLI